MFSAISEALDHPPSNPKREKIRYLGAERVEAVPQKLLRQLSEVIDVRLNNLSQVTQQTSHFGLFLILL